MTDMIELVSRSQKVSVIITSVNSLCSVLLFKAVTQCWTWDQEAMKLKMSMSFVHSSWMKLNFLVANYEKSCGNPGRASIRGIS